MQAAAAEQHCRHCYGTAWLASSCGCSVVLGIFYVKKPSIRAAITKKAKRRVQAKASWLLRAVQLLRIGVISLHGPKS